MIDPLTDKWFYTHKRLRSAHQCFKINPPYLFTYQKYSELNIPHTTNSLDGCFAYLKELIRVLCGVNQVLKKKIINPATWNPPASAGGGMRRNSREVALLQGASGSYRRGLHGHITEKKP